jgi:hypothetical protein
MNGRTPAVAFVEGLPKPQLQKEDKRAEKRATKQAADTARSSRLCQSITLSVQTEADIWPEFISTRSNQSRH